MAQQQLSGNAAYAVMIVKYLNWIRGVESLFLW
jgi:hypothetical protein